MDGKNFLAVFTSTCCYAQTKRISSRDPNYQWGVTHPMGKYEINLLCLL